MPALATDPAHAYRAFEAFAPYYDDFTAHHDYDAWTDQLLALATEHGWHGERVLDVACGTGKSLMPLVRRGLSVTACDQSPAMLDVARAKAPPGVEFHLCDARELPQLGAFDLVTVLCDIVNYLLEPAQLVSMFAGIARNLAPGGLVVFDANTLWMYDSPWASDPVVESAGSQLSWECLAGPGLAPGGLAVARLRIEPAAAGDGAERVSLHHQRHHPRSVISDALAAAGLRLLAVRGQFPDGRAEDHLDEARHSKAIYLAGLDPSSDRREVS